MIRKFRLLWIMFCFTQVYFCIGPGITAGAEYESPKDGKQKDIISRIADKSFGKGKLLRVENIEPSHVKGLEQQRIWIQSPYGERPYLIYISRDENIYFLGSVFNSDGDNLTEQNVGIIVPKKVSPDNMHLNEDYRIGSQNAEIQIVLWIGTDLSSKHVFENLLSIYKNNSDKMNIYIKFFPRGESDYQRMKVLTCFRGNDFRSALEVLMDRAQAWGTQSDMQIFKEARGISDDSVCRESIIREDLNLAAQLNLPAMPVVFINGTMLLDSVTSENISRIAGVPIK